MGKEEIREILKHKTAREIWLYIDDVLESGISIDEIIDLGGSSEPYDGYYEEHFERILNYGTDPMKLFKYNENWYKTMTSQPQRLAKILAIYVKYGLDGVFATEWLETYISGENFVKYAYDFEPFGIYPEDYKPAFFKRYSFKTVWDDIVYDNAPEAVMPDDIIKYYPITDIVRAYNHHGGTTYSGFENFVKEFVKLGGNINLLAAKYLEASGYPEDDGKLVNLAALVSHGATEIDANKIIDSLTYQAYSYKDRGSVKAINEYFYEALKDHADAAHLKKLVVL